MRLCLAAAFAAAAFPFSLTAEPMDIDAAVALALETDPRIEERRHLVRAAAALLDEVRGHEGWSVHSNAFLAIAPKVEGGMFKGGDCVPGSCELRDDRYEMNGFTPWVNLEVALITPLYTFGKVENYADAARANIDIKSEDVRLQRGETVLTVHQAYYGYLAARDGRLLLEDVDKQLQSALDLVQNWLDEGEGDVSQGDLFALQSGVALVRKFKAQAEALEAVALDGLKVITGVGLGNELEVADRRLRPLPLPEGALAELQEKALQARPEIAQLNAGLKARRALVAAHKAAVMPDVYAGVAGVANYTPGRDKLSNPYISDPFNDYGVSPVVGVRWNWSPGVQAAKADGAQAELDALISKNSFALQGIPYQVAEQYHQVQGHAEAVEHLETAARSARRWMVSSYADFEAGLEKAEKIIAAFQGYVLASSDYLETTYEYNMHIARLNQAIGEAP